MSITETKLMPGSDQAKKSASGSLTAQLVYQVQCDSEQDCSVSVVNQSVAAGLPQIGESYQFEGTSEQNLFVIDIDVTMVDKTRTASSQGKLFDYKVMYSNLGLDISGVEEQNNPNPLLRPPRMRMDFQRLTEEYSKDVAGDSITNSAKDHYDPLPTRNRSMPILVVIRNEYPFYPSFAINYVDRINTDTFFGVGPRKVYCDGITPSERQTLNDIDYYEVEYRFIFNHLGWDHDLLDIGFRETIGVKIVTIKDDAGVPGFRGWLLDGGGRKKLNQSGTPIYASDWRTESFSPAQGNNAFTNQNEPGAYKPYIAVPFAGMNLPNTFI